MTMGLVGRKRGMTRVFTDEGVSIPVTVIEAQPNRITQVKTVESDGYRALQVSAGSKKPSRVSKPEAGHFAARRRLKPATYCQEFRLADSDEADYEVGGPRFGSICSRRVRKWTSSARSIGKGFAGTVKRHNFRTQDATHGNSLGAPGTWLDRSKPDAGPRIQGQEDVRAHG